MLDKTHGQGHFGFQTQKERKYKKASVMEHEFLF
jgi:hypothetical protein